ncbi:hypothetical protein ACROYT_G035602 [Oculina patagonica]
MNTVFSRKERESFTEFNSSVPSLTAVFVVIFNSFLNPLIYSVRMRQFRVAFIELTCRTANTAEAEEIEMRGFGSPNTVVRFEGQVGDQQTVEQAT